MSFAEDLKKHQIQVDRLAAKQRKIVESELKDIRLRAGLEVAAGTTGKQLKENLRAITSVFVDKSITNLLGIAEKESSFIAKRLPGAEALTADMLKVTLLQENMRLNLGSNEATRKSLGQAFKQFANRKADEIAQIIRDGQAMGLSTIEIMRNVDERVSGLHTAQARVLSDTSTLYTSNLAQRETIATVSKKVVFTLGDSQEHTDVCLSLADKVFDADDAPTPPLHWGCNSYLVPIDDE